MPCDKAKARAYFSKYVRDVSVRIINRVFQFVKPRALLPCALLLIIPHFTHVAISPVDGPACYVCAPMLLAME